MEEVCVTKNESLMISYTSDGVDDRKSTYDGCFPHVNKIISWASKKQISVTLSFDEDEYTPTGNCGKQLLWMQKMLKKYNGGQDVMTSLNWDSFSKAFYANQFEE